MAESALRYLDQMYMMGIGQGPTAPRPQRTRGQEYADMLGAASLPLSGVPIAGDIAGFAADAAMYAAYPEERTMGNYAMSVLGGLPLIPSAAALRAAKNEINTDYRGSHQPPTRDYGAPLNDLTMLIPEDVYSAAGPRLYGVGNPEVDREAFRSLRDARGKPEAEVTVYRAVPENVSSINEGDWVTTSRKYADMHGESALGGNYKIIEQKAKAKDLFSEGYPYEFGYSPLDMSTEARMQRATEGGYLPETYYHATSSDFEEFVPKYADQLTFITPNVDFANNWLGKGGSRSKLGSARYDDPLYLEYKAESEKIWDKYSTEYGVDINSWPEIEQQNYRAERNKVMNLFDSVDQSIYPLRTNVQNTFDPRQNEDVIVEYLQSQGRDPLASTIQGGITDLDYYKTGNYLLYENPEMVRLLKNKGFDSMRLAESTYDRSVAPVFDTLAVFNPSNIRSVNAAFDPANRRSANILATAAGGTISLSALRQLMPQEEERPIE